MHKTPLKSNVTNRGIIVRGGDLQRLGRSSLALVGLSWRRFKFLKTILIQGMAGNTLQDCGITVARHPLFIDRVGAPVVRLGERRLKITKTIFTQPLPENHVCSSAETNILLFHGWELIPCIFEILGHALHEKGLQR